MYTESPLTPLSHLTIRDADKNQKNVTIHSFFVYTFCIFIFFSDIIQIERNRITTCRQCVNFNSRIIINIVF